MPLVANLEIAYQTAIDRPFRSVSRCKKKKHKNGRHEDKQPLTESVTQLTKRDSKLKGRMQPQDIERLSRNSESTLNDLSIKELIDVHRFRCQGVPFEHLKIGKVPHVSHHVCAYLNAGEALRYSAERDGRKLAQEYKAKCRDYKRKKLQNGNHRGTRSEIYTPQSTLIDFRHLPMTTETAHGPASNTRSQNLRHTRNIDMPKSPASFTDESTATHSAGDDELQNASVRKFYVRTESGTLPGDLTAPSKDVLVSSATEPDPSNHTLARLVIGSQTDSVNGTNLVSENGNEEQHKRNNQEVGEDEVINVIVIEDNNAQLKVHSGSQFQREDKDIAHNFEDRDGHQPTESDATRSESEKDFSLRDSESLGVASRQSSRLSPESTSGRGGRRRNRPKTARHERSRMDNANTSSQSQEREERKLQNRLDGASPHEQEGMITVDKVDGRVPSSLDKVSDEVDLRSEASHDSIGDASSLIDEPSIKSLSLQDTFSGSYSLDFEEEEESSAFDTISYHSRTRSKNGFISVPNEIVQSNSRNSGSRNSDVTTEEYIRTESVVSLR
ncbi:hypothetical protein BSL78_26549 [Apostichopus japonicus]|uniref:Uncharacterized protein n=1 Tax=Stichopus japonicus TaxID=307972 RepID=A0A2G8JLM4_STIJA|nr:hypothetical protein BSL78_26549 [Apostichopus japonicus]